MGPSIDTGPSPLMSALSAPQQGAKKPGINWLGVLADALSGAAGRPGPYAAMLGQQRQMQQEEQTYQHHKADALDLWRQQQEYEAAHPKPQEPSVDQRMIDEYVKMAPDDPRRPLYQQHFARPQAVTVTNPDGSQELRFITPGQPQSAAPPTAPVGELSDTPPVPGGQTPPASGSFPGHHRKK